MNRQEKIQKLYNELPTKNYFISFQYSLDGVSFFGNCQLETKPLVATKSNIEEEIKKRVGAEKVVILYYQEFSNEEEDFLKRVQALSNTVEVKSGYEI